MNESRLLNLARSWIALDALSLPICSPAGPPPEPLDFDPGFAGDGTLIIDGFEGDEP